MKFESVKKYAGPHNIDDSTLTRIVEIMTEVAIANRQAVEADFGKSYPALPDAEFEPEYIAEFNARRENVLRERVESACQIEMQATFASGTTIKTTDLDEFIKALRDEVSEVVSMDISAGRYSVLHTKISAAKDWHSGIRVSIQGDRKDVTHITTSLESVFDHATPDYEFLYGWMFRIIVAFVLFVIGILCFTILAGKFQFLPPKSLADYLYVNFASAIIAWTSLSAAGQLKLLFPMLQFEYGRHAKKRRAKIAMTAWSVSVLAIPAFMTVAGSLL